MATYQVEPTNEFQVREWFVAHLGEFGYSVLKSQQVFPDYVLQDKEGITWRAEVEFESENFVKHKHSAEDCDLVICWQHTINLPLPVLELLTYTLHNPREGALRDMTEYRRRPPQPQDSVLYYAKQCPDALAEFREALAADIATYEMWLDLVQGPRVALFRAQWKLEGEIREIGGGVALDRRGKVHPWDLGQYLGF